jgi:hypothetical protein
VHSPTGLDNAHASSETTIITQSNAQAAGWGSRAVVSAAIALLVSLVFARYPLTPWPLTGALCIYAAALWRWPALFLLVLPVVIPAYDLGLWTGWLAAGEPDFFIVATIAVLSVRTRLTARDLAITSTPALVLLAFTACWLISTLVGLASPLDAPQSDNPFLRPDNALRLAKPLIEALALLPFLRRRQRCHGDATTVLGWGLAAGLGVVTLIVLAERVLFASVFDVSTDYRVAGPFSSMRVGGGHIGAYAAMALPFSLTLVRARPRWLGTLLALAVCLAGSYTIAVTFARTAYAACLLGMVVTALGWLWSERDPRKRNHRSDESRSQTTSASGLHESARTGNTLANRNRMRSAALGIVPTALVLAAAAGFTGMHARFAASAVDYLTRQDNWRAGLAVRDDTVQATLFGMGLGTYQRAMLQRSPINKPTDMVLRQDSAGRFVSIRLETPFYLGQKIALPASGPLNLDFRARSPDSATAISTLVCDKILLYSDNCRGAEPTLAKSAAWAAIQVHIPTEGLGGSALSGLLRRPVELSFSGPVGHTIEIRDISISDDQDHALLANGDFAAGLDRWIFTDDSHVSWRMLNEYLMLFFETGILGLAAYLALAVAAITGGIGAVRSGSISGAAVVGAVTAFLVSGLFDNVLEAPRVATLFFLICCCGLIQWQDAYACSNSAASVSHS